jgi:hypothetical protein
LFQPSRRHLLRELLNRDGRVKPGHDASNLQKRS